MIDLTCVDCTTPGAGPWRVVPTTLHHRAFAKAGQCSVICLRSIWRPGFNCDSEREAIAVCAVLNALSRATEPHE